MDEKGLVRRCSAGDQAARQEMYELYAGRLLAVCRRYVREPDLARDLVHDTFLKAAISERSKFLWIKALSFFC